MCGNSELKDVCGEQEVDLATERHKSDTDSKGLRKCLCPDVGLRPGDTKNVQGIFMRVVGVCVLMDGWGGWSLQAE